jgi:hypothetical protein
VADQITLGYDIVSYETDGREKQIEVKAIQVKGSQASFFISRQELDKSRQLPNYYLYCVEKMVEDTPLITIFRHPDWQDHTRFTLRTVNFQVSFLKEAPPES